MLFAGRTGGRGYGAILKTLATPLFFVGKLLILLGTLTRYRCITPRCICGDLVESKGEARFLAPNGCACGAKRPTLATRGWGTREVLFGSDRVPEMGNGAILKAMVNVPEVVDRKGVTERLVS